MAKEQIYIFHQTKRGNKQRQMDWAVCVPRTTNVHKIYTFLLWLLHGKTQRRGEIYGKGITILKRIFNRL